MADFESAFEQEIRLDRHRRHQLRKRAVHRSKARRIQRTESRGKVNFFVLCIALIATSVTVTVVMFEVLAMLLEK